MRITYKVTWDDFLSVQKPFALRPGRNAGFIAAVCFCALMGALGVLLIVQGFGNIAGFFIIGLGILAFVGAWLFEKRAVTNRKNNYDRKLALAFHFALIGNGTLALRRLARIERLARLGLGRHLVG